MPALAHQPGRDARLPTIGAAPVFSLTTADGGRLALADLRGKVVAVTFIYATCTDTCPLLTAKLAGLGQRMGKDFGAKVAFVAITVDPERDTPDVLRSYAQAHGASGAGWAFLTGTPAEIKDVAQRYGVFARKTRSRRRRPHVPHLARGPCGRAARPVHGRPVRSGRDAARSPLAPPGRRRVMRALLRALPRLVARIPAAVHTKLLVAFLTIVGLLIALGAVGLEVLGEVNRRAEDLVKLQRKIAAYRQLQHDTTGQLYSVAAALLVPEDRSLDAILRQLNQFGYDLDRLQFVARDEVELLGRVRADYDEFIRVVTRVVELIRTGRAAEGRELQLGAGDPTGRPAGAAHEPARQPGGSRHGGQRGHEPRRVRARAVDSHRVRGRGDRPGPRARVRDLVVAGRSRQGRWTWASHRSPPGTSPDASTFRIATSSARSPPT